MHTYSISYFIDSIGKYKSHEESIMTSEVREIFNILDTLSENDTLYIDLVETKDALNISGSENGGIFLEVNAVKGGIFTKEMTIDEAKYFLNNITIDFDELDALGFDSTSI